MIFKNPAIYQKSGLNLQNKEIQMLQRRFYFVVVLIFLINGEIFGQSKPRLNNSFTTTYHAALLKTYLKNSDGIVPAAATFSQPADFLSLKRSLPVAPVLFQNHFSADQLSFFCKKEYQFEKATSVALRFRLGSIEYTDYLEGKPNAVKPR